MRSVNRLRYVPEPPRSYESGDRGRGFFDLRVGSLTSDTDGVGNAVRKVLIKQRQGYCFESSGGGGDLGEDVDAIGVFFNHALQPADLPFDATQALEMDRLDVGIARWSLGYQSVLVVIRCVGCAGAGRCR